MVREGYGTSGEGNGTVVGHPKMGTGEVLPLLARDPNYSSVPGSDAEPRLSDAGSGNEGPKKAARGRASVHGEVLLANKTLKKKPYKSLGWSLIAVRALRTDPRPLLSWLFLGLDVTARTQNPGFKPPDRSETPNLFLCRTRDAERVRPRERRAPPRLRTKRLSHSSDVSAARRVTGPRFRPDSRRAPDSPPPPLLSSRFLARLLNLLVHLV
jgi:hypothetical protein